MEIKKALLTVNRYSRVGKKMKEVKKIVVHWVGNANTSAMANRNYFENLKNGKVYASSHYIIGLEGEIVQCIPEDEVAYHATTANGYSIGIENCHPDWSGKFNEKTYNSLIELCTDICKRHGLDPETDILRHYDISKKMCPKYYVQNPESWKKLKADVKAMMEEEVDIKLIQALKNISEKGVKLDVSIWGNIKTMNMKYAKLMIEKIGTIFGKRGYRETIEYLVTQKAINSPEIWREEKFMPEYCRSLLIKISNFIQ